MWFADQGCEGGGKSAAGGGGGGITSFMVRDLGECGGSRRCGGGWWGFGRDWGAERDCLQLESKERRVWRWRRGGLLEWREAVVVVVVEVEVEVEVGGEGVVVEDVW